MADPLYKRMTAFLREVGIEDQPHTGKTYLGHLLAVHRLLEEEGYGTDACRAGLFHSVYGFVRVAQAELTNPLRHDYLGAQLYTLQRLSGVIAFFFVGFHVWSTRVQYYLGRVEITYAFMHGQMSDPLVFGIYVVGVLAAVFHFTNGLWTFCITWGITVGQGAQRMARALALVLFAAMYGTAFAILVAFRV